MGMDEAQAVVESHLLNLVECGEQFGACQTELLVVKALDRQDAVDVLALLEDRSRPLGEIAYEMGFHDCLRLIHFHIGSQITKIRRIQTQHKQPLLQQSFLSLAVSPFPQPA